MNCAWLVEQELNAVGVRFRVEAPQAPAVQVRWSDVSAALLASGELREWVPDFMLPYQKLGVLTILRELDQSGTLSHPAGAGKSLTSIVAALYTPEPVILVTRASARRTLQREVQRYTTIDPIVLTPRGERRAKDPDPEQQIAALLESDSSPRITIVGYETLPTFLPLLLTIPYHTVIFDEVHKLQNHKRFMKVAQAMETGAERPTFKRLDNIVSCAARLSANARRRIGATATWLPDRRRNMWSQLDMIHPGAWGKAWDFFAKYTDLKVTNHGNLDNSGKSNTEELRRRLGFVCHRVDSAETRKMLPPCRRQVLYITKDQQGRPGAFAKELARAKVSGMLREVLLAESASRKLPVILEYVADAVSSTQKVIIFSARHNDCARLEVAIRKAHPELQVWIGHGGHSIRVRDDIRDAFMEHPGPCVLVAGAGAFGESVSLHDADLAIHAMLPVNGRDLWQREGRTSRHGQKRPVLNLYPICEGTVDERMKEILLDKLPDVADLQQDSTFANAVTDLSSSGLTDEQVCESLLSKILDGSSEA